MDDEKLKYQIGANIAAYRKRSGLTQAGLAEKLNYSDKAVSKWERGESIPDVLTLMQLAEQFSITVNDLLADPTAPLAPAVQPQPKKQKKTPSRYASKRVIQALSSTLVWFVALLAFVVLSCFDHLQQYKFLLFFYAIPANAIVLLSLRSAWREFNWNKALISIITWGSLLSIYVTVKLFLHYDFAKVLLLGIPGQLAISLWFRMFRPAKDKEEKNHG